MMFLGPKTNHNAPKRATKPENEPQSPTQEAFNIF